MATNVPLRDLNIDAPAVDGRRIDVMANGLPVWQGAQIAVDATIVSPVRRDGEARPGADREQGWPWAQARPRQSTVNAARTPNSSKNKSAGSCFSASKWADDSMKAP